MWSLNMVIWNFATLRLTSLTLTVFINLMSPWRRLKVFPEHENVWRQHPALSNEHTDFQHFTNGRNTRNFIIYIGLWLINLFFQMTLNSLYYNRFLGILSYWQSWICLSQAFLFHHAITHHTTQEPATTRPSSYLYFGRIPHFSNYPNGHTVQIRHKC